MSSNTDNLMRILIDTLMAIGSAVMAPTIIMYRAPFARQYRSGAAIDVTDHALVSIMHIDKWVTVLSPPLVMKIAISS